MLDSFSLYMCLIEVQICSQLQYGLAFFLDVLGTSMVIVLNFCNIGFCIPALR